MSLLIIGAGSIGKRHAGNAKAMGYEVGLFDAAADKGLEAAEALGIKGFETLEAALASKPRGVIIASPHVTHIPLAAKAIEAGADVLIEKPVSHNEEGVAAFLQKAKDLGRQVFVVCNTRFHPAVRQLKENINKIGDVLFARAHYGDYLPTMRPNVDYRTVYAAQKDQGGGVILDVIHEIDYLTWLLGDVTAVTCETDNLSDIEMDAEDYATMALSHEGGARSEIHLDYFQRFRRRGCEIVGSKGTLFWQSENRNPERAVTRHYDAETEVMKTLYETQGVDANESYRILLRKFMDAIETGRAPDDLLTGEKAFESLRVALLARSSAEQGRRLNVRKFRDAA